MRFTYYTIIGKDPELLEGHLRNVKEYAGFDRLTCPKELLLIVYTNPRIGSDVTAKLVAIAEKHEARVVFYLEPGNDFLQNLYACWNLGYAASKEGWVFRGGSDQVFSKDSFVRLCEVAENYTQDDVILQANTIENAKRSPNSRHILADLGASFDEFKWREFEALHAEVQSKTNKDVVTIDEALAAWKKPTLLRSSLGRINRVDGCSWLMKKKDWEAHGPMPPIIKGVTGDVLIHDRLQEAGYRSFIVNGMITYHFVRGESKHSG